MSKDRQRLVDYLEHMLKAIERINRYTEDIDELAFLRDELIQDAVIRSLEILGEASNNVQKHYPDFATRHPELPLAFAYKMRNAVAHGYFKVDQNLSGRQSTRTFRSCIGRYSTLSRILIEPQCVPVAQQKRFSHMVSRMVSNFCGDRKRR